MPIFTVSCQALFRSDEEYYLPFAHLTLAVGAAGLGELLGNGIPAVVIESRGLKIGCIGLIERPVLPALYSPPPPPRLGRACNFS